ncbi:G-protein coupled receptor 4-like [Notolabrus celidotus]|uniref:G-protein coupled receptor 4-like n=1 Tax=Notolabrus celidotus TaxID=1203425 RepID=UPI00148FD4EF|nr:G-protein coupled receptor 4-like [Notolabrus celidotus]
MDIDIPTVSYVIAWIVVWIGFPFTLLAIYALYSLVQEDHVAPVYVINLLISDLIQMFCFMTWAAVPKRRIVVYVSKCIHFIGVMASVGFMVCVSLERYLVIACPLWYRFRRTINLSVTVSILTWAISFMDLLTRVLTFDSYPSRIFHSFLLLCPFPLLIFSFAETLRALSTAISVPPNEKRRIVGTLVLVLLNYTLLFLPWIIWLTRVSYSDITIYLENDSGLCLSFLQFSPLADLIMYVFMRKGAVDKLLACLCCCKMIEEQQGQITTEELNSV